MRTFNPPNLSAAKKIVIDTETTGLDWKKDKVVGYVLTWGPSPEESVYWPVRHPDGNYDAQQVESYIRELALRKDVMWIGHRLKFDLHMCANHRITFHGTLNCTLVNAALLNEEQGDYSLEKCAEVAKVQAKKGEEMYKYLAAKFGGEPKHTQMQHFHRLHGEDPVANEYARGDGTTTWQLWEYQEAALGIEKLDNLWDVECRVIRTLFRMERRGVRISMERYEEVCAMVHKLVDTARNSLPSGFNERSGIQMKELMTKHGHTGWPMTAPSRKFPQGQPSFTEKWLVTNEIGRSIVRLRKFTNLQNSFLDGQIRDHLHNGRIHTNFNQCKMDDYGTVTGRLSSSDPNLQQCPKRDKELAPIFRSIFIPDDGFVWQANDYKQQEFVVFADYSGSKALIDGYNQDPPVDMHQYCAELCEVERDPTAKRINLGKLYGMGNQTFAGHLGVPLAEAKRLSRLWDSRIPEAKQYLKDAEATAKARGYVRTKLGRRRRFPYGDGAHKAGNAIIQMCSADITKLKMVQIDEFFEANGNECQMLLQIHDELDWQTPQSAYGSRLNAEALAIMEDFGPETLIPLNVRLRVDASSGKNWSEATFG